MNDDDNEITPIPVVPDNTWDPWALEGVRLTYLGCAGTDDDGNVELDISVSMTPAAAAELAKHLLSFVGMPEQEH